MLHVCSLAALPETVRATGASHILTVMAHHPTFLGPFLEWATDHASQFRT
jgi:hypothetical protein